MRFDSSSVMVMLQRLEQVGSEAPPYATNLAAAVSFGGYQQAVQFSGTLHQALGVIEETKASLSAHVVPADGLGEPGDCLGEIVVRSRAMVIVDQLGRMRNSLVDPAVRSRVGGWFIGRFRHIDSVTSFIQDELHRIHDIWKPYRPTTANRDQLTIQRYRVTVRLAQRALEGIADEPDFAHFLTSGIGASEYPELSSACECIAAALAIRVDMGPRLAVGHTPKPSEADAWSTETRTTFVGLVRAALRKCVAAVRKISKFCWRSRPIATTGESIADIGGVKQRRVERRGPLAQ